MGVSLGPNDGAPLPTSISRRAGIALSEAPKLVLTGNGKQVLVAPEVYIVAPLGSPKASAIEAYLSAWGQSAAFAEQTQEYGIEGLNVAGILPSSYAWPSASFDGANFVSGVTPSNVEAAIAEALFAADGLNVSDNTLFVVLVPDGVNVSLSGDAARDACADGVLSWHAATRVVGPDLSVPYVALGACGAKLGLDENDTLGLALSHSLLNAIANPRGQGYHGVGGEPSAWPLLPGPLELASLCASAMANSPHVAMRIDGVPWLVHRSWSNARSVAGQPPCAPEQDDDYTVALVQDTQLLPVTLMASGTGVDLPGVMLSTGESVVLPVQVAAATRPTQPVRVRVEPLGTHELVAEITPASVAPGQRLELTLTLSPEASEAQYLVRLTSGRGAASFSQYLLVKRIP